MTTDSPAESVLEILHTMGERPVEPPERIAGGKSGTGVWRYRSEARGWCALRVFAADEAGVAARETAVMVHARAVGLPVPEVFASRRIGASPVMLLEWAEGGSLDRFLGRRPWQAGDFGRRSGELMARLHRAGAPSGLGPARDWPAPIAFPVSLRERLRASDVRDDALVHLDFHPANIALGEGRRLMLIDWTNARSGDPRFDLARTLVLFAILPGMTKLERAMARRIVGPFARAWRAAYIEETGLPADMPVFLAWAGYGMLAEWRFKRRRAEQDPEDEGDWESRLRGLTEGWMREAKLETEPAH